MKINIRQVYLIFIYLLWFGVLAARADRYVVAPGTPGGTNEGPYTSWTIAATQIQWAVNVATNAENVWVSNGAYIVTNQIEVTSNITVKSMNGWTNTLVYAGWPAYTTRCFYVSHTGVVDGFTISNGHIFSVDIDWTGGGAYISNGIIQNCYFVNNISSNTGSGVYVGGGGAYIKDYGVISNCWFVTNISYTNIWRLQGGWRWHFSWWRHGGLCSELPSDQ